MNAFGALSCHTSKQGMRLLEYRPELYTDSATVRTTKFNMCVAALMPTKSKT